MVARPAGTPAPHRPGPDRLDARGGRGAGLRPGGELVHHEAAGNGRPGGRRARAPKLDAHHPVRVTRGNDQAIVHMPATQAFLYAEDSENDVLLMKSAIAKAGLRVQLCTVPDGEEALRYLNGERPFS